MKAIKNISLLLMIVIAAVLAASSNTGCNIYKFNEATFPDSIKTVKVNFIDNRAQYINPQLSPRLTDKIRQKIVGQTRLSQTNNDNADWEISGTITQYAFSTSAISGQQVATNRLTIGVHIILNNRKAEDVKEYDISRSFEFKGTQSYQQAEASLLDEMTRTLTDEIFNRLFSNW
ncbi:MAG: LptE family protein [Bacteroidota bacterium]|nr:LptE family protein [Bacteroidota bacterium]